MSYTPIREPGYLALTSTNQQEERRMTMELIVQLIRDINTRMNEFSNRLDRIEREG